MSAGINYLRIFSVMITDWETNFTDLQANDFGNLGKSTSGNILSAIMLQSLPILIPPELFSVGNVCVENGTPKLLMESPEVRGDISAKWQKLTQMNAKDGV